MSAVASVPPPRNEPVLDYAPGSPERAALKASLERMAAEVVEIPVVVGDREILTGEVETTVMPHCHRHVLARWHKARRQDLEEAIAVAREAQRDWSHWLWEDRLAIFLKAADLLAGPWRPILNAATMLGQSKTAHQAEIDSACELIDFWRFNPHFARRLYEEQPLSAPGTWNRMDYRPLEGFIYAITPFNFTSIAGNLPTAPAMLGNVVLWKPASSAMLSAYYILRLLREAGLPPGVIQFVPGDPALITEVLLDSPDLAGIHFTGSTTVFRHIWRRVGERIDRYRGFPRLVGETGGKDFIVAHASADVEALVTAIVRGGYEYQGQKCSAASRIYVPDSRWPAIRERLVAEVGRIRVGDVRDFRNFMGAVIDRKAFEKIKSYLDYARSNPKVQVLAGGTADESEGYFVAPTLLQVDDPGDRLLCEEIFGPVVSVYVYPEARWQETLELVDRTAPYALTGAVFAQDRRALQIADWVLRQAAGNYYINDKPTGAIVGQQPFGGARASGTNDKAGSLLNLLRWVSPRAIKETFVPPRRWEYPFQAEP